jgi:hypothetical protein
MTSFWCHAGCLLVTLPENGQAQDMWSRSNHNKCCFEDQYMTDKGSHGVVTERQSFIVPPHCALLECQLWLFKHELHSLAMIRGKWIHTVMFHRHFLLFVIFQLLLSKTFSWGWTGSLTDVCISDILFKVLLREDLLKLADPNGTLIQRAFVTISVQGSPSLVIMVLLSHPDKPSLVNHREPS